MRALAVAFFLAGLDFSCAVHAQGRDAVRWQAFEMPAGHYKAAFPAGPVMQKGTLRTEIGNVVSTRHTADGPDATYDVTYNDYPKDGVARLSPGKLLATVRDGLVYQSKGRLVSEKPFTMGKLAGSEYDIAGGDGMHYRVRLLLNGNRLYQLTAMARPPARPEAQKFFDSFQLTGGGSP